MSRFDDLQVAAGIKVDTTEMQADPVAHPPGEFEGYGEVNPLQCLLTPSPGV